MASGGQDGVAAPLEKAGVRRSTESGVKVSVRVTGPVVLPTGKTREWVDLEDGATVRVLLEALGYPAVQARFFRVAVGGDVAGLHAPLKEGDEVTLMVPIGGG